MKLTAMAGLAWGVAIAGVPQPEMIMASNDGNFLGDHLEQGFARNAGGATVPAAYFLYSIPGQSYGSIWVTDGTPEGTHAASNPNAAHGMGTLVASPTLGAFFVGQTNSIGLQIYRTDGPVASARWLTMDSVQTPEISGLVDGSPIVWRENPPNVSAWSVDPASGELKPRLTVSGTSPILRSTAHVGFLESTAPNYGPSKVTAFRLDGTAPAVTLPLQGAIPYWVNPSQPSGNPTLMCGASTKMYSPQLYVDELWCSNGTANGTRRPIYAGTGSPVDVGLIPRFYRLGNRLIFVGTLPARPMFSVLWITDGTDAGTFPLSDENLSGFRPCITDSSLGLYFTDTHVINGVTYSYFRYTDGTRAGTRLVTNRGSGCLNLGATIANGPLAYYAHGETLYRTDGSDEGTRPVAGAPTVRSSGSEEPVPGVVVLGKWLIFVGYVSANREGIWRLDIDRIFNDEN